MLEKVTDRIYYLLNDDKNERPALGLVKGDRCCLVIDGGNSIKHAEIFLNEIKKMNFPPITYAIATHHHWDHVFGLPLFDAIKIASNTTYELAKTYWGIKLDDDSLNQARNDKILTEQAVQILKDESPNRDEIEEVRFDLLFQGELEINLGGITCQIKEIANPHRKDGTIVYVPQERTLFLGDAAYGRTKEGKSFFSREKLISMMREVNSYDAQYCLCSHESICTREEMDWYFKQLTMGLEIANGLDKLEDRKERFKKLYQREPSDEDLFFLESRYE